VMYKHRGQTWRPEEYHAFLPGMQVTAPFHLVAFYNQAGESLFPA
jgi:hypothetical protein